MPQGLDNQLAIRFAGTGTRRTRGRGACRVDGHRRTHRWFSQQRVGGHLRGNGRFCRPFAWPPATAHWDPGGQQIAASRRAVHTGGRRDPPHRPAQAAESKNLLLLLLIQDVAHSGEGPWARRLRQRLGRRQLMAGFAVSINGWIWVSTEGLKPGCVGRSVGYRCGPGRGGGAGSARLTCNRAADSGWPRCRSQR